MAHSKNLWERYASDYSDDSEDDDIAVPTPVTSRSRNAGGPSRTITAAELEMKTHECVPCKTSFRTKKELRTHKIKDPENHEFCANCDRDFETHADLQIHLIKSPLHIVCVDCFKEFKSKGGLEGHRKQMHRVSQPLHCPGCGAVFNNASGITQHVEGNGCEAGLTNAVLTRKIIQSSDPTALLDIDPRQKPNTTTTHIWRDGIIPPELKKRLQEHNELVQTTDDEAHIPLNARSIARNARNQAENTLPGWHRNQGNRAASVKSGFTSTTNMNYNRPSVLDYTDGIGNQDEVEELTLADMGSYWLDAQRIFQCPHNSCRKKFRNANAILQHMNSSTHDRKVFRCPTCCDRYRSASALLQHMESGSCGINETSQALDVTKSLTGGIIFEAN